MEKGEEIYNHEEIPDVRWEHIEATGAQPQSVSHHAGVLVPSLNMFVIYGGNLGLESSDSIHLLDLQSMAWSEINSANQKTNNCQKPGPRDDHSMVLSSDGDEQTEILVFGGFLEG